MARRNLIYRTHAIQRMFGRGIVPSDVEDVLFNGDVIRDYPDDRPYPSRLMLGFPQGRPLHVVAADVPGSNDTIVITVYIPDPDKWSPDFRSRKSQ